MENIVIGIEGLVGAGKTAICKELLNKIPNSMLLQGGNLYRAIVYGLMSSGISLEELKKSMNNVDIKEIMEKLKITISIENRDTVIYIDGQKIDEESLQSTNASIAVSEVSHIADNTSLFIFARKLIDGFKEKYNVIVSGRALMEIYPDLDYHFLVTASLDERVRRKCIKYNGEVSEEEVRKNIIKRDELQEKSGFYKKYEKTIVVDVTDCKTIEEGAEKILQYVDKNFTLQTVQ